MGVFKLLLCVALLQLQNLTTISSFASAATTLQAQPASSGYSHPSVAQSSNIGITDASAASTLGSLYRKSRQSRCVKCYEDRYGGDERSRGYGYPSRPAEDDRGRGYGSYSSRPAEDDRSRGYGSYSSRPAEERSNWYYPSDRSNDRYDERYRGGERDDRYYYEYNRYYRDRDDRYAPRTYDRYEGRGYDRYDDRRGSQYERGESRGYGYDNRDRYSGTDRYSDYYGSGKSSDRYYDRPRAGGASPGYGYDRDTYDRYYPRYDFRNYRPWDETYRGQSGFDNSGRGYYFASSTDIRTGADVGRRPSTQNQNSYYRPSTGGSPYLPQTRPETGPCGIQVSNCPYAGSSSSSGGGSYSPTDNSQTIYSGSHNGSGSTVTNTNKDVINKGWNYVHDRDSSNGGDRGDLDRDRDRSQQSAPYGGRPARPLGGSYLLDRDSNAVSEAGTSAGEADKKMVKEDAANMVGGSPNPPEPAALTSENQSKELKN